jgi:hypothetical protein
VDTNLSHFEAGNTRFNISRIIDFFDEMIACARRRVSEMNGGRIGSTHSRDQPVHGIPLPARSGQAQPESLLSQSVQASEIVTEL